MNITNTKKLIKFLYNAQLKTGKRLPVFLWAGAGVGKTQGVYQACMELPEYLNELLEGGADYLKPFVGDDGKLKPVKYHNLRLATKPDAGDIVGLPHTVETMPCPVCLNDGDSEYFSVIEMGAHAKMHGVNQSDLVAQARKEHRDLIQVQVAFAKPRDIITEGPAINFLDEMNRANLAVRDAAFTWLEDGRAGTHQADIGVFTIAAGNPPTEDYQVQDFDQEKAFMQRAIHIVVSPTFDEWLQYAVEKDFDPGVLAAVTSNRELLGSTSESMEFLEKVTGGRRNMEKVNDLVKCGLIDEFGLGDEFQEIVTGIIGAKNAVALATALDPKALKPIPAHGVAENFSKVEKAVAKYCDEKNPHLDLLMVTNYGLQRYFQETPVTDKTADNVAKYILAIPEDIAFGLIKMFMSAPVPTNSEAGARKAINHLVARNEAIYGMLRTLNERVQAAE